MERPKEVTYEQYKKAMRLIVKGRRKYLKGRLVWNAIQGTYIRSKHGKL